MHVELTDEHTEKHGGAIGVYALYAKADVTLWFDTSLWLAKKVINCRMKRLKI